MDDAARRRRATRFKVFQPAEMALGSDAPVRVHLLNVSVGGALVYAEAAPAVGTEVTLACGMVRGPGRVAWSAGRRFGVEFAQPIAESQVQALLISQDKLIESASQRLASTGIR